MRGSLQCFLLIIYHIPSVLETIYYPPIAPIIFLGTERRECVPIHIRTTQRYTYIHTRRQHTIRIHTPTKPSATSKSYTQVKKNSGTHVKYPREIPSEPKRAHPLSYNPLFPASHHLPTPTESSRDPAHLAAFPPKNPYQDGSTVSTTKPTRHRNAIPHNSGPLNVST